MLRTWFIVIAMICLGMSATVSAQDTTARTRDLLASLDKIKYKKKEKKDFKLEMFVDVQNEPVYKDRLTDYSGIYESEDGDCRLELKINSDGSGGGLGYDTLDVRSSDKATFALKDVKVDGALLSATKVYTDGRAEKFEAVFEDRTVSSGTNPNSIEERETRYGLGFIRTYGSWTARIFLEQKH